MALFLAFLSVFSYVSEYLVSSYAPGSALESLREPLNAFQLDRERSFPTLYVSTLWLLCAVLLAVIAFSIRATGARYTRHWGALAVIFVFLFSDELLQMHEEISPLVRGLLGTTTGFLYQAWVIPAVALLAVLAVLYAGFIMALPYRVRNLFVLAGLVFVTGAVGFEMIGGLFASTSGQESLGFVTESTIEETLEMLGLTVLIYALMEYLRLYVPEILIPPVGKKLS